MDIQNNQNDFLLLDIQQLSAMVHLSVKTIRSTLVKNPGALPPRLIIPGQKRLLWLFSDVIAYYNKQQRSHGSNPDFSTKPAIQPAKKELTPAIASNASKRRGRPTVAERMAKKAAV